LLTKSPSFEDILSKVKTAQDSIIVLDNITPILFKGLPLVEVVEFVHSLAGICSKNSLKLVILTHNDSPDDIDLVNLNVMIGYYMDLILNVEPLESGFTDGIDGQLRVIKGTNGNTGIIEGLLLYRVHEAGVHWFTRGNIK
jgi:archaellum biogenesis ATPase FlaH